MREKPGSDHLAQSLVTEDAWNKWDVKKSTSEQRSDTHRLRTVTSMTARSALRGKTSINPSPGVLPSHYFSLSLWLLPRMQTLPEGKCHLGGGPGTQWGRGRAGPSHLHSHPTESLPSLDSPVQGHPPPACLLSLPPPSLPPKAIKSFSNI